MPSAFVHIGFNLGYGALIMLATKGSFTPMHCLVLAFNGFLGPDIGSVLHWYFESTSPTLAHYSIQIVHNALGYMVLIAPWLSLILFYLSKRIFTFKSSNESVEISSRPLTYKECYYLSIAGCLFHFNIDHLFEENGNDAFFRWILSTGYFTQPTPPISLLSITIISSLALCLVYGFVWIHISSTYIAKQAFHIRMKYTFDLFMMIFGIYLVYLYISQTILNQVAVVGEEADLGVMVFIVVFHFAPILLCLRTI